VSNEILGIHHLTAIAGEPQRNVDFYTGVLGLRLVKLTVNFDDPGTYHLYFGDELGRPGTILTFFPWPGAPRGRRGTGQATTVSFSVPEAALGYWTERLKAHSVSFDAPRARFDEEVLAFLDPDGLPLELVAHEGTQNGTPCEDGPVPSEYALRRFFGVTLSEASAGPTASFLTETLGFRPVGESDARARYAVGADGAGSYVDVFPLPSDTRGQVAVGTVHHVAWRTPTNEEQAAWRERLAAQGRQVTPVVDRQYFRSIYFREPGGVLFEIATDPPGFTVDENPEQLGARLLLPPWLESERPRIEGILPPLHLPETARTR
jgi:catechol 2,3-dioxygenase-like lactoylglutathione lyase family enzyme